MKKKKLKKIKYRKKIVSIWNLKKKKIILMKKKELKIIIIIYKIRFIYQKIFSFLSIVIVYFLSRYSFKDFLI